MADDTQASGYKVGKGKPPIHTRFQPGKSGNPNGRSKSLLHRDEIENILGRLARMSRAQLKEYEDNPNTPMIEVTIAAVIRQAAASGDASRLQFLLDRTIGKVVDKAEVQTTIEGSLNAIDAHPRENVLQLLTQMHGPKASGEK